MRGGTIFCDVVETLDGKPVAKASIVFSHGDLRRARARFEAAGEGEGSTYATLLARVTRRLKPYDFRVIVDRHNTRTMRTRVLRTVCKSSTCNFSELGRNKIACNVVPYSRTAEANDPMPPMNVTKLVRFRRAIRHSKATLGVVATMESSTVQQLCSLRDAAARLSISLRTLRHRIDLGDIAAVRMGSRIVRISEREIQRVIRDGI